ncbi:MAG: L,D-transpeptidase family protein [Acidobacteria bacterium]|nr:L,D-transpeptidase family protein [Acidobacteriota bacterium]
MSTGKRIALGFVLTLTAACVALLFFAHHLSHPLPANAHVTSIKVEKAAHRLTLFDGGRALKTYRISIGRGGLAPKEREGDGRVPEGTYRITEHNSHSDYHLSLRVSYPTPEQQRTAAQAGIQPGGDIMVHGIANGFGWIGPLQRMKDWTAGCMAVTDPEIEEIYRSVPDGTVIEIEY